MTSLPGAFLGGIIVGVVEAVGTSAPIFDDIPGSPGTLLVFVVLLVVLTVRPQGLLGQSGADDGDRPRLRRPTAATAAAGAPRSRSGRRRSAGSPAASSGSRSPGSCSSSRSGARRSRCSSTREAVIFGIIGLSLNVLLGYVGQISLGHQAFVGIGAFTSAYMVSEQSQSFWLGVAVAVAIGGLQALVLGGVSLRITGLYFALVTLSYGLVAEQNIFQIEELTGGGQGQPAPKPAGFATDWRYYYLCLAFLAVVLWIDWRMMRTKRGRALLALRENPRVAATFGVNVRILTLFAFVRLGRVRRARRRAARVQRHVRVARDVELQPRARSS